MIRKTSFLLVAALLASAPSVAGYNTHGTSRFADAHAELQTLDEMTDNVRDYYLRRDMEAKIDRIEAALVAAERQLDYEQQQRRERREQRVQQQYQRPAVQYLSFAEAKQLLDNSYYESDKAVSIGQIAKHSRLTTEQAKALADELYYESGKRDALIALYPSVTDKHRFILATDILYYSSSRKQVVEALSL